MIFAAVGVTVPMTPTVCGVAGGKVVYERVTPTPLTVPFKRALPEHEPIVKLRVPLVVNWPSAAGVPDSTSFSEPVPDGPEPGEISVPGVSVPV